VDRLLLATCPALPDGEGDASLLTGALDAVGISAEWAVWDDPSVDWSAAPVLIRSTWDYTERLPQFLGWLADVPQVHNPYEVVAWNSDKTYLLDLAAAGLPVTPTTVVVPGAPLVVPGSAEFVVKPSVSAGSRGAGRFAADAVTPARAHADLLHAAGRTVLVQPYFDGVDQRGETALIYFGGEFSHAVRKGPMLQRAQTRALAVDGPVAHDITGRVATAEELAVGAAAVAFVAERFGGPLVYTRVDLLPSSAGPVVVELELTEPALFLGYADGAADRVAEAVRERLTQ